MGSLLSKWFGKPTNKECPEKGKCLDLFNLVLDGEATEEEIEYVNSHIDVCLPCLNDYNLEKSIKELLQSKCTKVDVPKGLAEEIRAKFSEKAN